MDWVTITLVVLGLVMFGEYAYLLHRKERRVQFGDILLVLFMLIAAVLQTTAILHMHRLRQDVNYQGWYIIFLFLGSVYWIISGLNLLAWMEDARSHPNIIG